MELITKPIIIDGEFSTIVKNEYATPFNSTSIILILIIVLIGLIMLIVLTSFNAVVINNKR